MTQISIGDDNLDVEVVAEGTDSQFYIRVEFEDIDGNRRRNEWQLNVENRRGMTIEWIEEMLTEWKARRDDVASLATFSIQKVDVARRGYRTDLKGAPTPPADPTDEESLLGQANTGEFKYSVGDRIAYYVDGPESTIYGYTTDAIVIDLPPIERRNKEPIQEKAEVDTGVNTKLIPTEWIVGPASEVDIDRPNKKI